MRHAHAVTGAPLTLGPVDKPLKSSIVPRVKAYGYTVGRCAYCGRRTPGIFCEDHDDLSDHDPVYIAR